MKNNWVNRVLFMMIVNLLLSACQVENIGLLPLVTDTVEPVITQGSNPLPQPTQTEVPRVELTPAATVQTTPPPTFAPDLSQALQGAKLLDHRILNDVDYLVIIQTVVDVAKEDGNSFNALVDGIPYNCVLLEQYANRLFCTGLPPQGGKEVKVQAFVKGGEKAQFEASFTPILPQKAESTSLPEVSPQTKASPIAEGTLNPAGGGGDQSGNGQTDLQPGGAAGGGVEGSGGGIGSH